MRIGIIGNGYVGSAMARFFGRRYEVVIHDPDKGFDCRSAINDCALAVVCVPTPSKPGGRCDTSIVSSVIDWLDAPLILLKSTVAPGTTAELKRDSGKRIVFSPEYLGESRYFTPQEYPHPADVEKHRFFVFGGNSEDTAQCVDIFVQIVGPHAFFYQVDETTAEVIKYWENCWGAMKVSFCNEMAAICRRFGVDYWKAREGWALDGRVEKMHSAVFMDAPGFDGKCLPKDLAAFYMAARDAGYDSIILKAVLEANRRHLHGGFQLMEAEA